MFYRETGVFHESYAADMALFPVPLDRWGVLILLLFACLGISTSPISIGWAA